VRWRRVRGAWLCRRRAGVGSHPAFAGGCGRQREQAAGGDLADAGNSDKGLLLDGLDKPAQFAAQPRFQRIEPWLPGQRGARPSSASMAAGARAWDGAFAIGSAIARSASPCKLWRACGNGGLWKPEAPPPPCPAKPATRPHGARLRLRDLPFGRGPVKDFKKKRIDAQQHASKNPVAFG
jgi:hypothetical protein